MVILGSFKLSLVVSYFLFQVKLLLLKMLPVLLSLSTTKAFCCILLAFSNLNTGCILLGLLLQLRSILLAALMRFLPQAFMHPDATWGQQ